MKMNMKRSGIKRILSPGFAAVLAIVAAISGCGEADTDDFVMDFYPDSETPGSNSVTLVRISSDPQILVLGVDAVDITGGWVYSAGFDLVYRDWILDYVGYEPGNFFETSGPATYQVAPDSGDPGRLVVGISLTGQTGAIDNDGTFIYLKFRARRTGLCPLNFENTMLKDGSAPAGNPITGVAWYGGYANVDD